MQFLKDKLASFNFWLSKILLKIDRDYKIKIDIAEEVSTTRFSVELLTRYKGTVLVYDNLEMGSDSMLNFDMNVISAKSSHTGKLFNFYCNLVLMNLIYNSMLMASRGGLYEDGTNDTGELDEERTVHEEDSTVSQKSVLSRKRRQDSV